MRELAFFLLVWSGIFLLRPLLGFFKKNNQWLQQFLTSVCILGLLVVDLFFWFVSFVFGFWVALRYLLASIALLIFFYRKQVLHTFTEVGFLFLALHLFAFCVLRVDVLQAFLFLLFLFLIILSLRTYQRFLYYGLLFILFVYGYVIFADVFMPMIIPTEVLFVLGVLPFWFSGLLRFSSLRFRPVAFVIWIFMNIHLSVFFSNFSHGPRKSEIKHILSQSSVKAVVLYPEKGKGFHGQLIRFAFESCDGKSLFLGSRLSWGDPVGLLRVSLPDFQIQDSLPGERVGDMVEQDCKKGLLYFPAFRNANKKTRGLILSENNLKNIHQVIEPPKGKDTTFFKGDTFHKRAYLMDDSGMLTIARLSDGKILSQMQHRSGICPTLLPDGDVIFLSGTCIKKEGFHQFKSAVCRYSHRKGTFQEVGSTPAGTSLAYDPKTNSAYVTDFFNGRVVFVNLSTKQIVKKMYVEPFVLHLVFSPKTRILTVSGYFTGNLYMIHADSGKILRKVYIGRRAHWMYVSRNGKGVYVATTQGVFFVELP